MTKSPNGMRDWLPLIRGGRGSRRGQPIRRRVEPEVLLGPARGGWTPPAPAVGSATVVTLRRYRYLVLEPDTKFAPPVCGAGWPPAPRVLSGSAWALPPRGAWTRSGSRAGSAAAARP